MESKSLCCGSIGKMSRKLPSRHRPCFTWLPHLALNSVWFFTSLPYPTSKSTGVLIRETACYMVKKRENKSYKYVVLVLE